MRDESTENRTIVVLIPVGDITDFDRSVIMNNVHNMAYFSYPESRQYPSNIPGIVDSIISETIGKPGTISDQFGCISTLSSGIGTALGTAGNDQSTSGVWTH